MTDAEWLACADPRPMLEFLRGKVSDRKLRLLAVGCCHRISHLLTDPRSRTAVEIAERYADGAVASTDMERAYCEAVVRAHDALAEWETIEQPNFWQFARADAAAAAANSAMPSAIEAALQCVMAAAGALSDEEGAKAIGNWCSGKLGGPESELLRHIIGNPFRPYPAPAAWPGVVIDLAQALYDGHANRLILADALEENGHQELAQHFRGEEWHMKGCWAMDVILRKE
ncbi:hypothetical protein AYO44_06710 [Planctomycetaceae bacterium SCGC AG-212-F19]|nr:hypothetical protein AYO44_06710 [Planctomycetaceae bacterium SCGC AG-212-F19]